jgi:hypothetical protein
VNRTLTRVVLAAVAPLILVSAVTLTNGVASAKKPAAATISCSVLTTTINWNPPLVPGTATSKTTQITFTNPTVSGCTTDPKSSVTAATSVTAKASLTKHGNSCSSLTSSTGKPTIYTFNITWNNDGGTSTIVFKGSHTNESPPYFYLTPGKMTGSYPSKTAYAKAVPNSTGAAAVASCVEDSGKGDVSSVTITGGAFDSVAPTT